MMFLEETKPLRILYVAKHDRGDNDDEGAIADALEGAGHEVVRVHEMRRHRRPEHHLPHLRGDLCLFHKWATVSELMAVSEKMPAVGWFFDLVDGRADPTLRARSESRIAWFRDVMPHCAAMFCTDGDWTAGGAERAGIRPEHAARLHWLMQGADQRGLHAPGEVPPAPDIPEIAFTGMVWHGRKRAEHIAHLAERWGPRFGVVGEGRQGRVHHRALAAVFSAARIVVAPDGPSSDCYWSNRVYLTLGLGGFLLHPDCRGLGGQFGPDELGTYRNRDHLDSLIEYHLENPRDARALAERGHRAVAGRHTYAHRVRELLGILLSERAV